MLSIIGFFLNRARKFSTTRKVGQQNGERGGDKEARVVDGGITTTIAMVTTTTTVAQAMPLVLHHRVIQSMVSQLQYQSNLPVRACLMAPGDSPWVEGSPFHRPPRVQSHDCPGRVVSLIEGGKCIFASRVGTCEFCHILR